MKKTAKLIEDDIDGYRGHASLYEVSDEIEYLDREVEEGEEPQMRKTSYVVVSAIADETYMFPANKEGNVVSWSELPGSYRGGYSHIKALENGGYEVS